MLIKTKMTMADDGDVGKACGEKVVDGEEAVNEVANHLNVINHLRQKILVNKNDEKT